MKNIILGILLTTTLALAMPASNNQTENWFQKKLGRHSPAVEQQIQNQQASTAYREDQTATTPAPNWMERNLKIKQGHYSRAEQTRLDQEYANTAYRAAPAQETTNQDYLKQYLQRKLGRTFQDSN